MLSHKTLAYRYVRGPQRRSHFQHVLLAVGLLFGLLEGFGPAPAGAIECGDVLGPGGTIEFTEDVGPCNGSMTDPALVIIGPVTVKMNHFKVSCNREDAGDGILILGNDAEVFKGTVENCVTGALVAGGGDHLLGNITARKNFEHGFVLMSANNTVRRSAADDNGSLGFQVLCNANQIKRNDSTRNGMDGFQFEGKGTIAINNLADDNERDGFHVVGAQSDLTNNTASNNGSEGFHIESNANTLTDNIATNHPRAGFFIYLADWNVLTGNTADGSSGETGFALYEASKNRLENNIATNFDIAFDILGGEQNILSGNNCLNTIRFGFLLKESRANTLILNTSDGGVYGFILIDADENRLISNTAIHHDVSGFLIEGIEGGELNVLNGNNSFNNLKAGFILDTGSQAATLEHNNALNNGDYGILVSPGSVSHTFVENIATGSAFFDLHDENPDCANNVWQDNFFVTSNQPCIN